MGHGEHPHRPYAENHGDDHGRFAGELEHGVLVAQRAEHLLKPQAEQQEERGLDEEDDDVEEAVGLQPCLGTAELHRPPPHHEPPATEARMPEAPTCSAARKAP